MIPILLLAVCVTLQSSALILGIYLLRGTFWRRVWLAIAIVLVIIGLRRSMLIAFAIHNQAPNAEVLPEVVMLTVLATVLASGTVLLYLMFRSMERSEAILREKEARFRGIVENTSAGYFCSDKEGYYTYVNPAWLRMHGYEAPEEVIGKHFSITRTDTDSEGDKKYQEILWSGKAIPMGESSCRRKDGSIFYHTFSIQPVVRNGEVVEIEGFMIDTTERREVEQALRESESRYHALFRESGDALTMGDLSTGKFSAGNPSALKMYGMKDEAELCRYTPWDLSPEYQPDGRRSEEKAREMIEKVLREGFLSFEWTHKRANGELFLADILSTRVTTKGGTIIQGTIRDVTKEKQAEQALRDSEERYNQLAAVNRTITWEVDASGLCTYISDVIKPVLGYDPEDIIGKRHCYEFGPESGREALKALAVEMLANKESFRNREYEAVHKDGHTVWLSGNGIPVLDKDGNLLRYRGMDTDITERKRMLEEKERLQEQFVHTQKIECVGRLAGGIAHDYNNKLGIILGYLEFAMHHVGSNEPLRNALGKIETAARSSVELTRQILTFARKQAVAPQHIDLNETVDGLLGMMRKVIGEDIRLTWKPGGAAAWIKIDPVQVDQILANLLLNARDAIAGSGSITVETADAVIDEAYCASNSEAVAGDYVLLAVSDDGCGMDKDTLANVFEPFFTTKDVGEGTGLGLSTVYGIVKQNDGFINVYSEPGQGTTFKIYLPRSAANPIPDFLPEAEAISDSNNEPILVVEDERDLLDLCQFMLESIGYHVFTANTPEEAVQMIEEHQQIRLVITDVVLPNMNGRDLVNTLLTHTPDLKVLYMSGYTADTITQRGILDPGVHFLQKPFSSNLLAAKVQEALHDA